MSDNYKKLFQNLEQIEPSQKLRAGVLARIDFEKRRSARIRLAFFGAVAVTSLVAIIPSFQYVAREFSQSGFYQYLSLLFSDSGFILASWKEFSASLVESLPLFEITIFLATVFTLLFSARSAVKNIFINYKTA